MDQLPRNYFTTGEFAKLHHINKRTLMYYDDIGLFKPQFKDNHEYRYYAYEQSELLLVILALRELDISVKEIKAYMQNRSPDEFISLLSEHKSKINDQMRVLERIDRLITKKIQSLYENKEPQVDTIEIVPHAEEYLALSEPIYLKGENEVQRILHAYMENCRTYDLYDGISISSMTRFEDIVRGEIYNYEYVYTQIDQEFDYPHIFIKPKGHYLTAYNKGGWDELVKTYSRIITYAKQNNLSLTWYSYEQSVIDESTTSDENEYITKISIQILTESMTNTQKRRSNQK